MRVLYFGWKNVTWLTCFGLNNVMTGVDEQLIQVAAYAILVNKRGGRRLEGRISNFRVQSIRLTTNPKELERNTT